MAQANVGTGIRLSSPEGDNSADIFLQKNILTAIITSMPDVTRIPYPKPFRILDFSIGAGKDLAKIPGMTYTNSPLYDLKENQFYNIYTL